MKKLASIFKFLLVACAVGGMFWANTTFAWEYTELAPLPYTSTQCNSLTDPTCVVDIGPCQNIDKTTGKCIYDPNVKQDTVGTYVNGIYKLAVAGASALAVLMIVMGGFTYVSSDAMGNKEEGKEQIKAALGGLLLILASWIILYTVNPQLVSLEIVSEPLDTRNYNLSQFLLSMNKLKSQLNLDIAKFDTSLKDRHIAADNARQLTDQIQTWEDVLYMVRTDPTTLQYLTPEQKQALGIDPNADLSNPDAAAKAAAAAEQKIAEQQYTLELQKDLSFGQAQLLNQIDLMSRNVTELKIGQAQAGSQGDSNKIIAIDSGLANLKLKYQQLQGNLNDLLASSPYAAGSSQLTADQKAVKDTLATLKTQVNAAVSSACTKINSYATANQATWDLVKQYFLLSRGPINNTQVCIDSYSIK